MARSKRLAFLSSLCEGHKTVLDIGTDHGLVLKYAFEDGLIEKAIASDLREKPLQQAKRNIKNYPVSFVISDGFLAISEPFDLAILAGMGAHLITDLMAHAPKDDHITYLLQANDKYDMLRKYLAENGFQIIDEYIIHDQFYYVIMKVKRGVMVLDDKDMVLGPFLKHKAAAIPYYRKKLQQIDAIYHRTDPERKKTLDKARAYYRDALV